MAVIALSPVAGASAVKSAADASSLPLPDGLSSEEARRRLDSSGPNSMPDLSAHLFRRSIQKLWAPVPWMLEASIVLQIIVGKYLEAGIITVLLLFNAALSFFQEGRAQATLATLKSRLAMTASVRRDGVWKRNCRWVAWSRRMFG
jgi:H+-transporting ATPase